MKNMNILQNKNLHTVWQQPHQTDSEMVDLLKHNGIIKYAVREVGSQIHHALYRMISPLKRCSPPQKKRTTPKRNLQTESHWKCCMASSIWYIQNFLNSKLSWVWKENNFGMSQMLPLTACNHYANINAPHGKYWSSSRMFLPIIPGQAMSSVSSRSAPGASWLKRSRGSKRASNGEMRSQDSTTLGLCTHTTSKETNSSPSRRPDNSKHFTLV